MIKVNVIQIDHSEIRRGISTYQYRKNSNEKPKYIIMSSETRELIVRSAYSINKEEVANPNNFLVYLGIPIAIDNELEKGEVRII